MKTKQIKALKKEVLLLNREIYTQELTVQLKRNKLLGNVDEQNDILLKNQSLLISLETQINEKVEGIQKIKKITNNIKN